jgi:hypothetical protein
MAKSAKSRKRRKTAKRRKSARRMATRRRGVGRKGSKRRRRTQAGGADSEMTLEEIQAEIKDLRLLAEHQALAKTNKAKNTQSSALAIAAAAPGGGGGGGASSNWAAEADLRAADARLRHASTGAKGVGFQSEAEHKVVSLAPGAAASVTETVKSEQFARKPISAKTEEVVMAYFKIQPPGTATIPILIEVMGLPAFDSILPYAAKIIPTLNKYITIIKKSGVYRMMPGGQELTSAHLTGLEELVGWMSKGG